jgi:hypothetical protein
MRQHTDKGQLVPYDIVPLGFEAVYTGDDGRSSKLPDEFMKYGTDAEGNVFMQYSLWGFAHTKEEDWNDEIRYINSLQKKFGLLDDNTRRIRQHIASLVCCDSGVPVTIDEILNAIGTGHLPEPSFHPGCWVSSGKRSTQPNQAESMKTIEAVLTGYLNGKSKQDFLTKYPYARGFIERAYKWFGPQQEFSELQRLLTRRMLLPFEFFTRRNEDRQAVYNNCFVEGGEGFRLDAQISGLAGLPTIYPKHKKEYKENLDTISDGRKKGLYKICGNITFGTSELSDCHHNTFRFIENWIYTIGTLKWGIPTRIMGAEGKRLGHLLFGYALGLDRWLQGIPHQFLLMDLGHIDLEFDPKNEILRVYAYLGNNRTPVNTWLAACLWYTLTLEPPASLYQWGWRHKELLKTTDEKGISVREWMESVLGRPR